MGESFFSNNNADKDGIVEYTNNILKNQYSSDSFKWTLILINSLIIQYK